MPEAVSSPIKNLLNYLTERGDIGRYETKYQPDSPYLGIGDYSPSKKTLAVISGGSDWGDYSAAHEIVHSLLRTRGQTNRMRDLWKKLPKKHRKDIVFPSSWERGEIAQPLTQKKERVVRYGPEDDPVKWTMRLGDKTRIAPRSKSRMGRMFSGAQKKQLRAVRSSIGPNWRMSGIANLPSKDDPKSADVRQEEGLAYYLTSEEMGKMGKRSKLFTKFLMNYGVPDKLAISAGQSLAKPEIKLGPQWYGGGKELYEMQEKLRKETEAVRDAQMAP